MNTPFTGFLGCNPSQKRDIAQSWWDIVDLVKLAAATDFNKKPGTLESRVFGSDVNTRKGAGDFIHSELPRYQVRVSMQAGISDSRMLRVYQCQRENRYQETSVS
jgi:hypothetical protein